MKTKSKLLNNKGFTIVETLIVLAIAAVIIIIVLLAVPALQRTTRNTDIKNDATAVAAAINDCESNNGGQLPATLSQSGGTLTLATAAPATCSTATVQAGDAVTYPAFTAGTTVTPTAAVGHIAAYPGSVCPSTTAAVTQGTTTGFTAGANEAAVFYPAEVGGGTINLQCVQG